VEIQGGDPAIVDDYARLPHVADRQVVTAERDGYVSTLDAELIGRASVALGAGRDRVEDAVDPAVGIVAMAKPGDEVRAGDPILELHSRDRRRLDAALPLARQAVALGSQRPAAARLIVAEIH